jgi:hypothetical protein
MTQPNPVVKPGPVRPLCGSRIDVPVRLAALGGFQQVGIDQVKAFRAHGSHTPGHPESFETEGVECTTGPLGQGVANAVGIALKWRRRVSVQRRTPFLTTVLSALRGTDACRRAFPRRPPPMRAQSFG